MKKTIRRPKSLGLATWIIGLSIVGVGGCGDDVVPVDSGTDSSAGDAPDVLMATCTEAADCDDGLFCSGVETCEAGTCAATDIPNCDDGISCTLDRCSEERRECVNTAPDEDGDGRTDAACLDSTGEPLGDDCDDADSDRYPGNREVCDEEGHDEDCDPSTYGINDVDSDGFHDALCCNPDGAGGTNCGNDCDDVRANVNITATEACDRVDNDCDGMIDEEVSVPGFIDADRDGFGDDSGGMTACPGAVGFTVVGGDCDDTDVAVRPDQLELCDEVDNDCDMRVDEETGPSPWYIDTDGDGYGRVGATPVLSCERLAGYSVLDTDCSDDNPAISPLAAEACDGVDNDCNGEADFEIGPGDFEDDDGDGLVDIACPPLGTDCDDRDPAAGPGAPESCDGRDNDCDENVDEGTEGSVWYRDLDNDGFGSVVSGTTVSCLAVDGYRRADGDCDDSTPDRSPGVSEACNAADDDCNALIDDGAPVPAGCAPAGAEAACVLGSCGIAACAAGRVDCDRSVVNGCEATLGTADHCTGCFDRCAFSNAEASCAPGGCELGACLDLWGDCDANPANGCEQLLSTEEHCGGCGSPCPASGGQVCLSGTCVLTECPGGFEDCNGDPTDGCETNLTTITNCGRCGVQCDLTNVATASCMDGRCDFSCDPGFFDCNSRGFDGCETNLDSDLNNCGGCDRRCLAPGGTASCNLGTCEVSACDAGRDNCNGDPMDGCETAIVNNPFACGDCTSTCFYPEAAGVCTGTSCSMGACRAGFADCANGDTDGCESFSASDFGNCGGCGNDCGRPNAMTRCTSGSCEIQNCFFGWGNCDASEASGCETNLFDPMSCGACGNACGFGGGCFGPPGEEPTCEGVLALATGTAFSCAIIESSEMRCWGSNSVGQLGNGTTTDSGTPVSVEDTGGFPVFGFTQVATGNSHTCAIASGRVYCWGSNSSGQLGNGSTIDSSYPIEVFGWPPEEVPVKVAAGNTHSCALFASGAVGCWGSNFSGEIGDGTTGFTPVTPTSVIFGGGFLEAQDISAGGGFTCAIDIGGAPVCWGINDLGQLGRGFTSANEPVPAVIPLVANATSVTTGGNHACMVRRGAGDYIQCWGSNFRGQIGDGTTVDRSNPTSPLTGLASPIAAIEAGTQFTCGVDARREVYCWGANNQGQIGDGTTTHRSQPTAVLGLLPIEMFARIGGGEHALVWAESSNTVFGWGSNQSEALNTPNPPTSRHTTPQPLSGL